MSDRNIAVGPDHDPARLEAEVIRLRDDCGRILRELEQRYQHALAGPRRLGAGVKAVEERVVSTVRARPVESAVVALLALGTIGLVAWELRMRRRRLYFFQERQLRRARRRLRGTLSSIGAI